MKYLVTLLFVLSNFLSFAQTTVGDNPGYYGVQFTDQQLYDLMAAIHESKTRSGVSIQQELQYGMRTFQARLQYPYITKGFRGNTFFLYASPYTSCADGGCYVGQSVRLTAKGNRSWLPANLYNTIFNPDSSINSGNPWAVYCDSVARSIGAQYQLYEVENEPDITGSQDAYTDTPTSATSWHVRSPLPDELYNTWDSVSDYIQMIKIASLVIKHRQPTALIATGGLGYPFYYQWLLRGGAAPYLDVISIHIYPYFDWTYCVWAAKNGVFGCNGTPQDTGNHRNSDYAMNSLLNNHIAQFRKIETQEGAAHKRMMITETNIPEWSYIAQGALFPNNKPWGNPETERNYTIKAFVKSLQDSLINFCFYALGNTADSGLNNGGTGSEIDAMGAYNNLAKATPGHTVVNQHGTTINTMATLLANYTVNLTPISTLAAGTDGVEFDSSTNKIYVVWAVTQLDTSEAANGTFPLPVGITFKGYIWNNTLQGTYTGSAPLTGDPLFLVQTTAATTPPTVSAGSAQNITGTSTTLVGTASAGSGSLTSTIWSQVSGPNTAVFGSGSSLTTTATGLISGTYVFRLTATNSNGQSATSNITVTVAIAPLPPTAVISTSATTIILPLDSVLLNGSTSFDNNSGGSIASYAWQLIGGTNAIIRNAGNGSTYVVMNTSGIRTFQLTVTNTAGVSAIATVTIIVNPALTNPTAVISISTNVLTLPTNNLLLFSSGSVEPNPNSSLTTFIWQLVFSSSGSSAILLNSNQTTAQLVNLTTGTYTVSLTVKDNNGLTSAPVTVTITVNGNRLNCNCILKSVH